MKKRIFARFLCAAMILSCASVALAAESPEDAFPAEDVIVYEEPAPELPAEEPAPEAPAEDIPAEEPAEDDGSESPAEGVISPAEELPAPADTPAETESQERVIRIRPHDDDSAAAARYEMSEEYLESEYYEALCRVGLTGDQRRDIVAVALSQVGYQEKKVNLTEYARYTGTQGYEWCASFVSWCAGQAGIGGSVLPVASGAYLGSYGRPYKYSSRDIQPGDIICFNYGEHVGIVYDVDDVCVYTVEGNVLDQVCLCTYAHSSSRLTYYYSPDYQNAWYTDEDGALRYRDVNTGEEPTGWLKLGANRFYIHDDGVAAMGMTEIDGETYLFDDETGLLTTGWLDTEDGWLLFDAEKDGAMCTGWYVAEDAAYCFDDDGLMLSGHQEKDGETVYYATGYEDAVGLELFVDLDAVGEL